MQEIPIVLIGHKDHGKSTLIGRLLLDTKSIKESRYKEVQEVDRSWGRKFELAHLVDSFKEEREREMTIDTTRVFLKGQKRNYQLIDVPGHKELISNMLTGASAAEVALLVIAIDEGIKEQTKEHLQIAKLLGIKQLGVVINKMDKAEYRKDFFEEIRKKLNGVLTEIGYIAEKICFFPISAFNGDNVVEKSKKMPWYQGETLMEFLENKIEPPGSLENSDLIFLIQDNYQEFLVGKVESGKIKKGQEILILPDNKKTKILSIKDGEESKEKAVAGQNVGIEIPEKDIQRGAVIVEKNSILKVGNILSGEVFWIERPSQRNLILECGTSQVKCELKEPINIFQGRKTTYQVSLEKEIAFDTEGKTILGKIVLKDKGKIIGVGNIL